MIVDCRRLTVVLESLSKVQMMKLSELRGFFVAGLLLGAIALPVFAQEKVVPAHAHEDGHGGTD